MSTPNADSPPRVAGTPIRAGSHLGQRTLGRARRSLLAVTALDRFATVSGPHEVCTMGDSSSPVRETGPKRHGSGLGLIWRVMNR